MKDKLTKIKDSYDEWKDDMSPVGPNKQSAAYVKIKEFRDYFYGLLLVMLNGQRREVAEMAHHDVRFFFAIFFFCKN